VSEDGDYLSRMREIRCKFKRQRRRLHQRRRRRRARRRREAGCVGAVVAAMVLELGSKNDFAGAYRSRTPIESQAAWMDSSGESGDPPVNPSTHTHTTHSLFNSIHRRSKDCDHYDVMMSNF
jgi:hypothetical protein